MAKNKEKTNEESIILEGDFQEAILLSEEEHQRIKTIKDIEAHTEETAKLLSSVKSTLNSSISSIKSCLPVLIEQMDHAEGLPLPEYKSEDAAGMDLMAATNEDIIIEPGKVEMIPTGIKIKLPTSADNSIYDANPLAYQAEIRPRSGLAYKHSISIINTPGTIDADYRGEIKVLLVNFGDKPFTVSRGDRIAQMVVTTYEYVSWRKVDKIEEDTVRGSGGFDSTGHKLEDK